MNVWEKRRQPVKGGTGRETVDIRERKKIENVGRRREVVNIRAWKKKRDRKAGNISKRKKEAKGWV